MKLGKATKAIVAAAIPLVVVILSWIATGEFDQQELSVAITGIISTVAVYVIPNSKPVERAETRR